MSPIRESACPSCGAPVAWKTATAPILVCEYCTTVIARGDFALESLGKVAELFDTRSPLALGLRGKWKGVAFELVGRVQLRHQAGGIWDEWYAHLADGRWGWLAEAQGRFHLTFEAKLSGTVPELSELRVGQPVPGLDEPFVVAEVGTGTVAGARGEIPWRAVPGAEVRFADLSGPGGTFATLDRSEDVPRLYAGQDVTLADLGIATTAPSQERPVERALARKLACPQCGGPLLLRAPDKTERVGCPQCGSLLDVKGTKLEVLKALSGTKVEPVIPLGKSGQLRGVTFDVIGFLQRSVEIEGERYRWEEYLLYEPRTGFRWLVRSDDHWSFVEPVAVGDVVAFRPSASYRGKSFKAYSRAQGRVEHVLGELYWKVEAGETVRMADYVAPPEMLSRETACSRGEEAPPAVPPAPATRATREKRVPGRAEGGKKGKQPEAPLETGEVSWSLGTWLDKTEVEAAFGVTLPRPTRVAPHQPFRHGRVYRDFAKLLAALALVGAFFQATAARRTVHESTTVLAPVQSASEGGGVICPPPFELRAFQNVKVVVRPVTGGGAAPSPGAAAGPGGAEQPAEAPEPPVGTDHAPLAEHAAGWFYANGELSNEDRGTIVHRFALPTSWSSPDYDAGVLLPAVEPGRYALRFDAHWEKADVPVRARLTVSQDWPHDGCGCCSFFLLALGPLLVGFLHLIHESARWKDSWFEDG